MNFVKQLLVAFAAVVGTLIVIALLLPSAVHVERSILVTAHPEQVFSLINDLRGFHRWSPWARIDPDAHYVFSDPSSGRGAEMRWSSDHPNVGNGSLSITDSVPDEWVAMELDFGPKGKSATAIRLSTEAAGTRVTWDFDEDFGYNLVGRYFGLMLDGLIGAEFEKGLGNLKALLEE